MQFKISDLIWATTLLAVVSWLAIPRIVLVADGHFQLELDFVNRPSPDSKIGYVYCWNEEDARQAKESASTDVELYFLPIELDPFGKANITLPRSGKSTRFGEEISFNEPKFIVLQVEIDQTTHRTIVELGEGRGNRTLAINLD